MARKAEKLHLQTRLPTVCLDRLRPQPSSRSRTSGPPAYDFGLSPQVGGFLGSYSAFGVGHCCFCVLVKILHEDPGSRLSPTSRKYRLVHHQEYSKAANILSLQYKPRHVSADDCVFQSGDGSVIRGTGHCRRCTGRACDEWQQPRPCSDWPRLSMLKVSHTSGGHVQSHMAGGFVQEGALYKQGQGRTLVSVRACHDPRSDRNIGDFQSSALGLCSFRWLSSRGFGAEAHPSAGHDAGQVSWVCTS